MARRTPTDLCERAQHLRARGDELAARAAAKAEAAFARSRGRGSGKHTRGSPFQIPDVAAAIRNTEDVASLEKKARAFYARALEAWDRGKCRRAPTIKITRSPPPPRGWTRARGMSGAMRKHRRR